MGKRKHEDLKQHWVCEDCEKPVIGKDPPDECPVCCGRFFDNLHDIVVESELDS